MEKETKKQEQVLPEGITAEMIAAAKEKHGADRVRMIDVAKNEEGTEFMTVLAIVPTRTILGQYTKMDRVDPKRADELLVKACLLSHKDIVVADDGLFNGALAGIAELIPIRKAVVKNC